ncbi:MAG: tRNA (N(6)-L-threonylcarbamoyladenosine(37)-C(2))-methylthiotransferase [Nanoarchaeota archaeon]
MNIHIHTQGCTANQSDSEVMAGILKKAGYSIVDSPDRADLIVLNTCTVKSPTEMKAYSFLKKWKDKKFVVAGCIPQSDKEKVKGYSLIGTRQVHRIAEVVDATLQGHTIALLDLEKSPRLNLPKVRKNRVIEIIPINAGCLGSCAFCKTKQARGSLFSYALHDIVKQVETAVKEGIREIHLTSQDTGAYGRDIKTDLPTLLRAILRVEGDFRVRVGMMNPDLIKGFLPDIIDVLKHPKMFKFLHIPVQVGSDSVLKAMRRFYTVKDFVDIVMNVRQEIPNVTLWTDIIVGFPGETQRDFQKTYALLEDLKIPVVNISKFYPRPGTLASKMQKIPTHIVKERSTKIAKLQKKIISNREWLGWEGSVLIDEQGKGSMIGRNDYYKQVIVKEDISLGSSVLVRIVRTTPIDLHAEIV